MTEPPYSWSSPGGGPSQPPAQPPPDQLPPQGYQYGQPAWLQPGVVPLRPLALGEILDGAIKVIRRHPRPTLGLSAAIALVVTTLNVLVLLSIGRPQFLPTTGPSGSPRFDSGEAAAAVAAGLPAQLLSFVAGLVLTGALISVVGRAVRGQDVSTSEVWSAVRPRLAALLGLALLTGLIVLTPLAMGIVVAAVLAAGAGPATLLVGIPVALAGAAASVYLYIRLSLAPPAVVLERASVRQAMRRSAVLVTGSWWRIFGILVLSLVITLIVGGIIGVPIGILGLLLPGDSGGTAFLVSQQVGAGLASVLVAPFSSAVGALLYVDRRMRAEGLDVALRAAVDPGAAG